MRYYSYFPGCSAEATSVGLGLSVQAIAKPLDIELIELEDWTCCGSIPYGSLDELESICVAARNLALAEKTGLDLVTPCSSCYVTLNKARIQMEEHPQLMAQVNEALAAANLEYSWECPSKAFGGRVVQRCHPRGYCVQGSMGT